MERQDGPTVLNGIHAVSIDFFDTLVFHRQGSGRGRTLIEYLEAQGFGHAEWEHQVLYDVFEDHDERYRPDAALEERQAYHVLLARRVFERLQVQAAGEDAERHAAGLWQILGPSCFEVFPDAWTALSALRAQGYPIVIVSNWQRGLRHFCAELGLASYVDHVLGSADLGMAKPEPAIFEAACTRLRVQPKEVVHVGDSFAEDYQGGEAAGLHVVLLQREAGPPTNGAHVIRRLDELPALIRRNET